MTPPGSATAPLLMLLMITAQRVTSQERGRPSSPGGIPQDHAEAISLGGDPLETKGERGPDLWVRKDSDEQPRPMRFTLYEPGSFQRPRVRGTNDRKGSDKGNTKKEVEKRIGDNAGGDRQKQSSGKSESSKTRTRKRKEKRAKSKKKQKKMKNKVNKKTLKKGKSKKASQNNNTAKHRGKKGNSQKRNKKQNNKEAREPKEEKGKNIKKKSLKKKAGKSNAKKPKHKIKVSNTKPKIRQVSAESCVSSTEVGVGEVVAVEGPGSRKAVDCKHTIRTRKGNTLKMTCPRFSLSPGRCKDERVVIKEIGKGKFKKKYCKGEIPGEDVSEAALRAVTFVHRRAKLKGKQCAVGFLCLFSASEISGKVSECGGKYQLQEGESMIVAPATFGDKISCKYTFKSPPGSTLALSCPSFNLNQRGCGRERVIVREKKAKYKKKFCKTSNPAKEHGQTTSNSLTLTHKRKKLKDNDCETGFWCQVSVVKGQSVTEQPTIGQSVTEQPTIGLPITDKPIVGQPVTDKPSIGQPVTDKPSQEPTTKPNPQTTPQPTSSQVHGIITTVSIPQATDVEGGFADIGGGGSAGAEDAPSSVICPAVVCYIPEEVGCTEVPGVCCSQWICGDGPRECTLETGEVYQIGETWTNDCETCNCMYTSEGADIRCYKRYCIPAPHKACVEVFTEGECCPDYHCSSTTCLYENRYYGVGESWQTVDNCQTCSCSEGDPIPEIKCDEPEVCRPAPNPACRPIVSVKECCPVAWDCTDAYLITVPKVFVRGGQSTVCVFLEDDLPISVNLTVAMTIGLDEIHATVLDTVSDSHVCVDFHVPDGGDASGYLSIMGTVGAVHVSKELRIHLLSVSKTFVQTDKYLYETGQSVQFRVLSVKGERAAISYEALDEVWITSPMETRLIQWLNVSNDRGLVQLEFPLAEHVQEGTYTIHVRTEGRITTQAFKVEPYVLPRFEVTVHPPPYTLVTQAVISVEVCADYTYGQPVTGSGKLFVKKNRYYYFEMDIKDDLTIPIPTFSGCTNVEVDTSLISTEGYGFIGNLALTAEVTEEGTGHMASGTASIQLATRLLSFTQISRVKDAKPGLPFEMQIQARFPDDTGAEGVEVNACVKTTCKNFVTDQNGVFNVIVPPHLVEPEGKLKVTLANEEGEEGNLGHRYPSISYFYFSVYYSESNSSLSLAIPTDAVDCTPGEDISLSLPVLFVANNIDRALMRVQVISRSQVVFTRSFEQDLVASGLSLDEAALLEPMADLAAGFVRGSFTLELNIPYYASPSVNVLIWYSTGAGEVIAASGTVEVSTCLPTVADLAWAPSNTAAPKDEVQITITATPNSICSLGVVDRSVEILSRGKTGSLSTATVFQLLKGTEPYMWLNSQIDNYAYCSGHSTATYFDDVVEDLPLGMRSHYWMSYITTYIDALSAFNDATVLVLSDLTIETRPCERQDDGSYPIYIPEYAGGPDYGGIAYAAPPPGIEDGEDSGLEDALEEEEEETQEPRVYFPETWLWDIREIGETGSTSFSAKVPDTVTEWVGEAVCVNSEFGLGLSPPTTLTVFTPFFLDLTMPPSVRRQERVPLRVSVFNYLDQTLPISVSLSPNATFTADETAKSVCVPASSMQVAEFIVVPQEAGDIWLTFSASVSSASENCAAGDDLPTKSDVMIKPLKVVFEGVQREMVNSVFICEDNESESWSLSTPSGIIEGSERVFVSASADLLGPTIENLGHLVQKPYGCGEQNMINFVPNILVVRYLNSIGQGDSEIVEQATSFMITGYQRELTYRRDDGSYSAFGNRDLEGSTWLTAFVLRSFAQASDYITIDDHDLQMSANWLLRLQMDDGCFRSVGDVHNTAMKGGLGSTSSSAVPLSAYVVIALSEAGHFGMDALPAAVSCIKNDTAATDVYSESLKAYALALSSSADAPSHITAAYNLLTDGDEGESIWVESAAYAVLAMLKDDHEAHLPNVIDLIRRLSSHRNSLGGFHSTQDTILALQAFAEYSILFPPSDTNLELTVTAITSFNFLFLSGNQSVALTREVEDPLPYNVTVTPSGKGCAVFMVVHRFHMPEISGNSTFSMTVTSTSGSCTAANVTICAFYLLENEESNMVIIELDLESGYVAEEGSLQHLVDRRVIKKYEQDEPGLVELYLDSLTSTEVCLTVAVTREISVEDVKPGTVSIYDYYQNSEDKLVKPLAIDRTGCGSSFQAEGTGLMGLAA